MFSIYVYECICRISITHIKLSIIKWIPFIFCERQDILKKTLLLFFYFVIFSMMVNNSVHFTSFPSYKTQVAIPIVSVY